jgi:hypothetical protein
MCADAPSCALVATSRLAIGPFFVSSCRPRGLCDGLGWADALERHPDDVKVVVEFAQ